MPPVTKRMEWTFMKLNNKQNMLQIWEPRNCNLINSSQYFSQSSTLRKRGCLVPRIGILWHVCNCPAVTGQEVEANRNLYRKNTGKTPRNNPRGHMISKEVQKVTIQKLSTPRIAPSLKPASSLYVHLQNQYVPMWKKQFHDIYQR